MKTNIGELNLYVERRCIEKKIQEIRIKVTQRIITYDTQMRTMKHGCEERQIEIIQKVNIRKCRERMNQSFIRKPRGKDSLPGPVSVRVCFRRLHAWVVEGGYTRDGCDIS